jgi:hypothetical protein
VLNHLVPNLAAPEDIYTAAPVAAQDVNATKDMLENGTFSIDSPDAPLRLLAAVARQIGVDFALVPDADPEMTGAACARTADFSMANDFLTENTLYLLGSDFPAHVAKGLTLRLDMDFDSREEHMSDILA